jgi:hypothetical protein
MKTKHFAFVAAAILNVFAAGNLLAADLRVRQPVLDAEGHFWVYRNGLAHPPMPFSPYGWMSDITNLTALIKIDLDCTDQPNPPSGSDPSDEKQFCIRAKITWGDATWASIAFISGPDQPPWWGENERGRHYDLSSLPKKKLVFYARGEQGGETIKAQIGLLGDKPFGDSLHQPIVSDEITLTKDWVRHEIDLKDVAPAELGHICNGFGVNVERANQPGSADATVFYLDDIYFE